MMPTDKEVNKIQRSMYKAKTIDSNFEQMAKEQTLCRSYRLLQNVGKISLN